MPGLDRVEVLDWLINKMVFLVLLEFGNCNLVFVLLLNCLVFVVYFTPGLRVVEYEWIFMLVMLFVYCEVEYGISVEQVGSMFVVLRDEIECQNFRVNFIMELWFMAVDHFWLSSVYERVSCQFGVYTCENVDCSRFFQIFHDFVLKHIPCPYWGKISLFDYVIL